MADHGYAAASNCIGRAARTLCAALRAQIDDTRTLDAVMASRGAALLLGAPYGSFGSAMASARYRKLDALPHCASAPCSTRSRIVLQGGDSASTSSSAMTFKNRRFDALRRQIRHHVDTPTIERIGASLQHEPIQWIAYGVLKRSGRAARAKNVGRIDRAMDGSGAVLSCRRVVVCVESSNHRGRWSINIVCESRTPHSAARHRASISCKAT